MTDNSVSKQQAAFAADLIAQGYTAEHAGKAARQAFPTPAQARMAQIRAAKNGRATQTATTGGGVTATFPAGYHTPQGRAAIAQAASRNNRERWARVRELGLRSLHDLAKWEAIQREQATA